MQTNNETRLEQRNYELKNRLKAHGSVIADLFRKNHHLHSKLMCLYITVAVVFVCLIAVSYKVISNTGMECSL